ncbi:CbtB domain-containing protein [Methylopila sp. M107]|uniref:CbtB domain-containing protein n=1 Tax=Methylopila sp. M107 TaxID=1101190 RepID=UPI000367A493|nr:CbtB domain-containing protein [Methylopila sp. M107]
MSNVNTAPRSEAAAAVQARALPIVSAFLLGVFVIMGAGFVSIPAVHNAAHDQRHAIGFPCH